MLAQAIWYVYELVDPRTDEVFYVGKGTRDRMYQHGLPYDNSNRNKINRINSICYSKVIRRKIAEFWDEKAAYKCESDRIKQYDNLTNIAKVSPHCRVKTVSFMRLVKDCMSFGKKTTPSFNKMKRYFPRHLLPMSEYRELYDMAERITAFVESDNLSAKKRVRLIRSAIPA